MPKLIMEKKKNFYIYVQMPGVSYFVVVVVVVNKAVMYAQIKTNDVALSFRIKRTTCTDL